MHNFHILGWRPGMIPFIEAAAERDAWQARVMTALPKDTADRVVAIVQRSDVLTQKGLLRAVFDAAASGEDFSQAQTCDDLENIYIQYWYKKALGMLGAYGGGSP